MAVWLELRCELRGAGLDESSGARCWSDDNSGPSVMANDTKRGVYAAAGELFAEAEAAGWVRYGNGWFCPNCHASVESAIRGKGDGQ